MTKIIKFENEQEWLDGRRGKATATKVSGLIVKRGTEHKMGFWELVAETVALPPDGENRMDRGKRLEQEAIEYFTKETGKKVNTDLVLVCRDDDPRIAYSPDGLIGKTEDVEVKCLSSALHIKALVQKKIPHEYEDQMIHGFSVNDSLRKRYMVFYDPRMPIPFFYIEVLRKDHKDRIKYQLDAVRSALKEVDLLEAQITF